MVHARVPERRALPAAILANDSLRPAVDRPSPARRLSALVGNPPALDDLRGGVRAGPSDDAARVHPHAGPVERGGLSGGRRYGGGLLEKRRERGLSARGE